jgi:hypothetical protein
MMNHPIVVGKASVETENGREILNILKLVMVLAEDTILLENTNVI